MISSAFTKMITFFFSNLLIWWITWIAYWMLAEPCVPEKNPTWSGFILLSHCQTGFAKTWWRVLASELRSNVGPHFSRCAFLWVWYRVARVTQDKAGSDPSWFASRKSRCSESSFPSSDVRFNTGLEFPLWGTVYLEDQLLQQNVIIPMTPFFSVSFYSLCLSRNLSLSLI